MARRRSILTPVYEQIKKSDIYESGSGKTAQQKGSVSMKKTVNVIEKNERIISREMIKSCAAALFEAKGVDGTSVNDIVKNAGIAKGTFYLYFKNKDDLINEVFEKYGDNFFRQVILKNKDLPKIVFFAESIIEFFTSNRMFLIELRKNIGNHREYPYYKKTMTAFSGVILNFLNLNEKYPITQLDTYSEIIISTILDICYRLIIEGTIKNPDEARVMLEDFLKRFFDCEQFFS
jgi:AcrR family transcriptional regulator